MLLNQKQKPSLFDVARSCYLLKELGFIVYVDIEYTLILCITRKKLHQAKTMQIVLSWRFWLIGGSGQLYTCSNENVQLNTKGKR